MSGFFVFGGHGGHGAYCVKGELCTPCGKLTARSRSAQFRPSLSIDLPYVALNEMLMSQKS